MGTTSIPGYDRDALQTDLLTVGYKRTLQGNPLSRARLAPRYCRLAAKPSSAVHVVHDVEVT